MDKEEYIKLQNNDYNEQVNDRTLNNMILYLRIRVAEFQYVDNSSARLFDFISKKKYKREEVINLALKHKWTKEWNT